jgi:hypothetical protein
MVITTNRPLAAWAHLLHDADLAEIIIDRVLAHGRLMALRGESCRTRHLAREPAVERPRHHARITGIGAPEFPERPGIRTNVAREMEWTPQGADTIPGSENRHRRAIACREHARQDA